MTINIKKIEAAALAATQGEWVVSDHIYASDGKRIASYQMISRDDCENEANATHIATANPSAVLELIEKYKALEAKYERLKPRHEAYVKMLGELLAVLHADGGHYQYEHGTEKAVADAITKYYELKRQLAELTEWNNQIGRTNYELRKQLEGEKAAALNYRADALDAERQLAELKGGLTYRNSLVCRLEKQLAECKADAERDATLFRNIRELCGYVENGSDTTFSLFQDDATKDWTVKVGSKSYYSTSAAKAIDAAMKEATE